MSCIMGVICIREAFIHVSRLPVVKSENEALYNAKYWGSTQKMNKFGAFFKGDILRFLMPTEARSVLEFGCNGGHIIAGLPDHLTKYCIEINEAARNFALMTYPLQLAGHMWDNLDVPPASLKFDFIYTTSVLEHCDCPICELRSLKR
eukprot:Selendium_serpulae@DN11960_c0_g1_i1.p1